MEKGRGVEWGVMDLEGIAGNGPSLFDFELRLLELLVDHLLLILVCTRRLERGGGEGGGEKKREERL